MRLPLKEFFKASKEDLNSFLLEVYSLSRIKKINPEIVKQEKYRDLLNSLNRSNIDREQHLETDIQEYLNDKTKIIGAAATREGIIKNFQNFQSIRKKN